jgi:hypothetical protein
MFKLLTLLLLALPAQASDWSTEDTQREVVYISLVAIDALTTMDMKNHPDISEQNPLLGINPAPVKIIVFDVATTAIQFLITESLPSYERSIWQYIGIGAEVTAVSINWSLGLRVKF